MASQTKSGFIPSGHAQIHYETAGSGTPFVMIHAGVADLRQWNNEFAFFSKSHQVVRYDLREYGQSEPVAGDFNHMDDLLAVLNELKITQPVVLMGCSMGGGLGMDFTLAHPARVKALIMVGSAPSGLELDVPSSEKFAEAEKAYEAGDLDLTAEIETQIWFDGTGRTPAQVNQEMRKLAYAMNRNALAHDAKHLGKRLPNGDSAAFNRLAELTIPVLVIVGVHDTHYILAAGDYMAEHIPSVKKVMIEDAAHLPNMDHPDEFRKIVQDFLGHE